MTRVLILLLLISLGCSKAERERMMRPEYIEWQEPACRQMIQRLPVSGGYAVCPGGRLTLKGEYTICECPPFQDAGAK